MVFVEAWNKVIQVRQIDESTAFCPVNDTRRTSQNVIRNTFRKKQQGFAITAHLCGTATSRIESPKDKAITVR